MISRQPLLAMGAASALVSCGFRIEGDAAPGDGMSDANADASGTFDPAACPPSYVLTLPSTVATSRYRVITVLDVFWPHEATCANDVAGTTHLVSTDTMQELVELALELNTTVTGRFYLGGVQSPTATARDQGWITFSGSPLLQSAWHTPESEPDDGAGDLIENQGQQLLILDRDLTYLHDATGVSAYGAVCECDGIPIAAAARAYINGDPNHP